MYLLGLIIGVVSFIIGLIPFIGWIVVPLNIIAVCIGLYGMIRRSQLYIADYNMAVASFILGGVPLFLKYIIWH